MKLKNCISFLVFLYCIGCNSTKFVRCDNVTRPLKEKIDGQIAEFYEMKDFKPRAWKVVKYNCINDSIIEVRTETKIEAGEVFRFGRNGQLIDIIHLLPMVY